MLPFRPFFAFSWTIEPGKHGFAVKCGDYSEPQKVSFLSPDFSVSGKMDLPFDRNAYVIGGSCGGLLYFHSVKGHIFLCNPSIEEGATLNLPGVRGGYDPYRDSFMSSCLGYDAKSDDFKLIMFYHEEQTAITQQTYWAGMYSFKRGRFVNIKIPPFIVETGAGVYVKKTGSCYWVALSTLQSEKDLVKYGRNSLILPAGESLKDEDIVAHLDAVHVVSFDCTTEHFNHLPLPQEKLAIGGSVLLVECFDSLGALFYWYEHEREEPQCCDYESYEHDLEEVLCIQLSVWNGVSWDDKCIANIPGARRPLGLKDDCLLFVEQEARVIGKKPVKDPFCRQRSELMVFDLRNGQLEKLNIYDRPGYMSAVFSYGA